MEGKNVLPHVKQAVAAYGYIADRSQFSVSVSFHIFMPAFYVQF